MITTPRALVRGYPWMDTIGHELVHLFLSRASRDRAPVWLQEGVAKFLERRWRGEPPAAHLDPAADGLLHRAVRGNTLLPFKSTLFGAAQMALSEGGSETVSIQPVAIAYTRLQGLPMERRHRPHAAWIGDLDLMPHLLRLLREGAMDVEVHFGEPITFTPGDDREKLAREVERQVRDMFAAVLRNPA